MEPTSVLTFEDLIREVALKMGTASYGEGGNEAPSIPDDSHDLEVAKRHVNSGLRMFVADAPTAGWHWTKPIATLVLWPSVPESAGVTVTAGAYDAAADTTPLTASEELFYPSMEEKTVKIDGVGDFRIRTVASATSATVYGDASAAAAAPACILADGNYTLPATFSGQTDGKLTYTAGTNRGAQLDWTSEAEIRAWRQGLDLSFGDPWWAAVRPMPTGSPRRRWEMMLYPTPDSPLVIEYRYALHFDKLIDLTETPPAPFTHDETIRAACRAVVERDEYNALGTDWAYYTQTCLPNSHRIDSRSAPHKLGYFGNPGSAGMGSPIQLFRSMIYNRPTVRVNP